MDRATLPTEPWIVVGLGNEIARDDGAGIAVCRALEERLAGRADVAVVALPWAGLALLEVLAGRCRAALVDALTPGLHPPGTVVRLMEGNPDAGGPCGFEPRGSVRLTGFHDLDLVTALALGRRLGWPLPDEIAVWAISGAIVDEFGEELSPEVAAAVPRVSTEVLRFLDLTHRLPAGGAS